MRVHDIANPFQPVEVAHFVPELAEGGKIDDHDADALAGMNINDAYVDENRIVYTLDRQRGGLYIFELTI